MRFSISILATIMAFAVLGSTSAIKRSDPVEKMMDFPYLPIDGVDFAPPPGAAFHQHLVNVTAGPGNMYTFSTLTDAAVPWELGKLVCETSSASPTSWEIQNVVFIVSQRKECKQHNLLGSKCTTLAKWNGADASLCGKPKGWVACSSVAWALQQVEKFCIKSNIDRAGGRFEYQGKSLRSQVH
ncbi:hypothetical protein BZA05DRAFT_449493 [Tricharina praecox]|uniref:uncharacterized protein n=1 Tax=Tricharina praecox TaxID=43433 RepID=UPI00221EC637|nr:uncharacterized protein BZA05DRAFT_449493 [Tricharina praecox]KAI5841614.1 hypothetical protein BZA05DRAFT_449493 [Tricharina praecox]